LTAASFPEGAVYFEDLPIGAVFELGTRTVSEAEIIAFAREYDPQPFHLDRDAAARSSFGGLVASGLHTFGIFSRLLTDALMGRTANLGGAGIDDLRWLVPVRPGDTLRGSAVVVEGTRPSASRPDRGIVVLRGELHSQTGALVWHADIASAIARRTG
jgi:acyl dehydratase